MKKLIIPILLFFFAHTSYGQVELHMKVRNSGGGSGSTDTTSLSARINLKLAIADSVTDYVTPTQLENGYYPLTGNPSNFLVAADIAVKANNSNTITVNGNIQTLGSNPNFTVSGVSGSGISKILPGFGQLAVNDSTTKSDTTVMATLGKVQRDSSVASSKYAPLISASLTTPTTVTIPSISDSSGKLVPTALLKQAITNNYTDSYVRNGIAQKDTTNGIIYFLDQHYIDSLITSGQVTLVSGTASVTIAGVTSSSKAATGFVSIGGTVATTWQYQVVCTADTLTITAITNTGTTNTSDTSVLNYFIKP